MRCGSREALTFQVFLRLNGGRKQGGKQYAVDEVIVGKTGIFPDLSGRTCQDILDGSGLCRGFGDSGRSSDQQE